MTYNVGLTLLDLGGLYSAGLPTLTGVIDVTPVAAPGVATATPAAFSLSFASLPNPPVGPGTMYVSDASGPGDFFRSGVLPTWPAEPVAIIAGTGIAPRSYAALAASLTPPINIKILEGITVAIGFATAFMFSPFRIILRKVVLSASSTPGMIRAAFSGEIDYFTLFIPRRSDLSGSVDLQLTPSGNARAAGTVVNVHTRNLSLSPAFITPLSTPLLALLAPAFSDALGGPLTAAVNTALAPVIAAVKAMSPLTPMGTPLFSAASTVSARRITVTPGGVVVQAVLSELVSTSSVTPVPPPGGGSAAPGSETRFVVTIDPPPEMDVSHVYAVRVRRESDLTPVEDATVTIVTYAPVVGSSTSVFGQTDVQGAVLLETTLRPRYRPSTDPTHTGEMQVRWPALTVTKTGFQTYTQELSG